MTSQTVVYKAKALEPRNLTYFFLIAFGLAALAALPFILGLLKMPSGAGLSAVFANPSVFLITLGGWGPIIAAFTVTAFTEGKTGARELWKRFWNNWIGLKWLFVTLLLLPGVQLLANTIMRALDRQQHPLFNLPNPSWTVIPLFVYAFIFTGMAEEFGWRGYVLPRLQAKWNALTSSIVLAVIWAAWHIPNWLLPVGNLQRPSFWLWALGLMMFSILMTWVFNNTRGSIFAAALFHAMINTGIFWFQLDWHYYGVLVVATVLVVSIFGPKNLVRQSSGPAAIMK